MTKDLREIIQRIQQGQEKTLISVDLISPNPWNPNEMNATAWKALGQSISKYGIHLVPLVVRPRGDKFQIIDGEHRYKWACDLGIDQVSAIVIDVDDFHAKKLTQVLNRTRGEDNPVKLKELLDSLLAEMSAEEVIEGMAIANGDELEALLADLEDRVAVESFDWDTFENAEKPSAQEKDVQNEQDHKCPKCGYQWTK